MPLVPLNQDAKRGWSEQLGKLDAEQRVQEMALKRAHEVAADTRKANVEQALSETRSKRADIAWLSLHDPFEPVDSG